MKNPDRGQFAMLQEAGIEVRSDDSLGVDAQQVLDL